MTRFQRKPSILRLVWDDEDNPLNGLVVRAKSLSIGSLLDLLPLIDQLDVKDDDASIDAEALKTVFRRFASALVDWNYDDEDGHPIPATYEGLMGEETTFVMEVIKAWADGMVKAAGPLPDASSDTPNSPEAASIPMGPIDPGS